VSVDCRERPRIITEKVSAIRNRLTTLYPDHRKPEFSVRVSTRSEQSRSSVQLSVIVVATDDRTRGALKNQVSISRRISHLVDVRDSVALRHELAVHHYDLAILMLEDDEERLPACLLRYPDLRVLVIVPHRKTGPLDIWLQQGASEVVSMQKPASLTHALGRLIDECSLISELHQANEKIHLQQRIHYTLLSNHPHAVMLRCEESILDANDALQSLLRPNHLSNDVKSFDDIWGNWLRWLSPESRATIDKLPSDSPSHLEVTSQAGNRYKACVQAIQFPAHQAQLISIDPEPLTSLSEGIALQGNVNASVSRVSATESLNARLQAFLGSTLTTRRYTAMLVQFPELASAQTNDGVERTLQDLSINRAHDTLKRCFPEKTLLARASKSALLLVSPASDQPSRSAANYAHEVLGSLGGLTDADTGIKINTLTVSPESLNASEMIRRLGSHARAA